jgi:hypothetical protein
MDIALFMTIIDEEKSGASKKEQTKASYESEGQGKPSILEPLTTSKETAGTNG